MGSKRNQFIVLMLSVIIKRTMEMWVVIKFISMFPPCRYREVVDHNATSGNDRKTMEMMEEMRQVYGYKANVEPTVLASTSKRPRSAAAASSEDETDGGGSDQVQFGEEKNSTDNVIDEPPRMEAWQAPQN
jgi:hypothetical protein